MYTSSIDSRAMYIAHIISDDKKHALDEFNRHHKGVTILDIKYS